MIVHSSSLILFPIALVGIEMEPKSLAVVESTSTIHPIDTGPEKAPTTKTRKKTMTSVYLKYFETAPDGKIRKCKFCGQSYSIATATGNLGRHLSNRHPGYDITVNVASPAQQPVIVPKKPQPQSQAHAKVPQLELDHLNWLLVKWLILASLPPSTLDEHWIVNSFKFLNPTVKLWPREKFQTVLYEVFRSMQEDVRVIVDQISSKVSITLDFWTSYEQLLYMSITCQWIDENWSFQRLLLDICHISSPCGATEISHALLKVLNLYNIDNRVLCCTHDNSPIALHACHTLKEDMDSQNTSHFYYLPCAAHTLNSIINDGLRSTKTIISKIREFVLKVNTSFEISQDFLQCCNAYQEGNWQVPLDASPRWSGNYQMLDIARKAGKSMETIVRKYDELLGSRVLLSTMEKNAVNIMHAYLEPFYKTINDICTNKVLTIGLVLFFMDHISEIIAASKDSRHSPDWLKSAEEMATKARSYNDQVCNVFTYMTAILDPRIKVELIPESLNSENHLEEARRHFMRNYSTSHFASITGSYAAQELEDGGSVSFAEEIARKKRRASMSSATDELTQYLSEPPASIATDVLEWWKVNSTRYPRLSVMARDFLAAQPTALAPEDLFCSKGDEIEKQRFSTPYESTQALHCVKSWMQGGFKLKYKSTEIDYERLMELATATAAESSMAGSDKKQKS
ncbi:zinc finger BED domain-containing protein RICESLEEPER 1 isoform X1 [Lycium ferocissimum]|uniref:zinc finger BED domain-containing protein RICESLEEPER 1 isoform X1 n=1 Tax=Lycium ferocissimum TaxID=112874 RepID=UPI0028161140|nr:zinc finger BED domain-containing protein RICESLEEPER 1 isoform X1 [Lycium ferocissimum]XP_059303339.1 zinc finger BED domain-containing protein RICESLEEPER 1 isoform X1 [Lycium ferocissimum]